MTTIDPDISPGALLRRPAPNSHVELGGHLWGFGGLHGGLALAMLTAAMRSQAHGVTLRSVTGRFHRPIRKRFEIETAEVRSGRTIATLSALAAGDKGVHLDAAATFGTADPGGAPADLPRFEPEPPTAPPPEGCPRFEVPTEFVPIANQCEIRPVGPNRPYAGGSEPILTAWIRLVEDDEPPDPYRLVFLMDALAPSYAAVLPGLQLIPTVELAVRPSDSLDIAPITSPWVLLHAVTRTASPTGWVEENIDAWSIDGTYLGTAQQLRLIKT